MGKTTGTDGLEVSKENKVLAKIYHNTARWYDFLDAYWERQYQKMRPLIIGKLTGHILEAGVGTGRNLPFYQPGVDVTAIDLSPEMLAIAKSRAPRNLEIVFEQADATSLQQISDEQFDWYVATFLYCVMPDHLQRSALDQMERVLKLGGKFQILEIVYSKSLIPFLKQKLFAPYVRRVYGAEFDRNTLEKIQQHPKLLVTQTTFLKGDTYLLIEGEKVDAKPAVESQNFSTEEFESLMKAMVNSWGSTVAVFFAVIISLLTAGTMMPRVSLLSFESILSDPIKLLAAWRAEQSFGSLFATGIGTAVGFFAPSRCAQELAAIRTNVPSTEAEPINHSNRFFAFKQAAKTALSTMTCQSVGGFIAGPAGAMAGSAVGSYFGSTL